MVGMIIDLTMIIPFQKQTALAINQGFFYVNMLKKI